VAARAKKKAEAAAAGDGTGAGPGAWLELSVEADVEAVEAVSEILGRVAPGGTSVEPAFELVEEGLGARVLDVGCGSGILAIAALGLGATSALGVDTDPIAIEATTANARRNHVIRRLHAREGSLPSGEAPFDVVLANLIAGVLVPLAPALHDELRPGGALIASGIFIDREAEVRAAFEAAGLTIVERLAEGDWVALGAIRPV
jgi:ribosomal protein L11 methyltransferase